MPQSAWALTGALLVLAHSASAAAARDPPTPLQIAIDAAIARGDANFTLKRGATYVQGASPLVITASHFALLGNGATLSFAPGAGVLVDASTDVALLDVTVSYNPRCFTQGSVVAYDAAAHTVDVRIDAGFPQPDAPWFKNSVETKLQFFDGSTPARLRVPGQSGSCIVNVQSSPAAGVWRVAQAAGFGCIVPPLPHLLATISPRINAPAYQIPQGYGALTLEWRWRAFVNPLRGGRVNPRR